MAEAREQILVLGIGNVLLGDDGVGPAVISWLQKDPLALTDVALVDGGSVNFALSGSIEESTGLIVVDAARLDAEAGEIRLFHQEEMDRFLISRGRTVHEVGLADLLAMARLRQRFPQYRVLIGIQPEWLDWSIELTPAVARAVPRAAALVGKIVRKWRGMAGKGE